LTSGIVRLGLSKVLYIASGFDTISIEPLRGEQTL
jgi:hypothetical protein